MSVPTALDPSRRAALRSAHLAGLMADAGQPVAERSESGLAAALSTDGQAWVLLEDSAGTGGAIAWAARRRALGLRILVGGSAGRAARWASYLRTPTEVAAVDGRQTLPAEAEPLPVAPPPSDEHLAFIEQIEAGGATPVVEHGVVAGEVAGLEVCRVVDDAVHGTVRLEVGVGAHDRETFQLLHGDRPTVEALADVVTEVARHRAVGAAPHPLNALAGERLLRSRVMAAPALIGAAAVRPAQPPFPRRSLKDAVPCVGIANIDGESVAAVFSTGVDVDLVLYAADARAALGLDDVVVVVPRRDALPVQTLIAEQLLRPVRIIAVDEADVDGGASR